MKLTKHEHACLVLEKSDDVLVIDPGNFSTPLDDLHGVVAVVITHEHPDHWTPEQLDRILETNPDATIYAPTAVASLAAPRRVVTVAEGDSHSVGAFTLAFYGSTHAVIHSSIPVVSNVGVLVNDTLYYAGDSYTVPPVPVDTLAVPSGAPWLKIGDAMDYVLAIKPKRSFPTHEMVLSVAGKTMANGRIDAVTREVGGEFFALEPGDTLDL